VYAGKNKQGNAWWVATEGVYFPLTGSDKDEYEEL
jgi:hypothetical protein